MLEQNQSQIHGTPMKPLPKVVLLLLLNQVSLAADFQSVASIQSDINSYLQSKLDRNGQFEIAKAVIDPHLQLTACSKPLNIFTPTGQIKAGNNTIGVRCEGSKPWTIYSLVNIKNFVDTYILTQNLKRNDLIQRDHLRKEARDAGTLPKDYVVDLEDAINKQIIRNLTAGSVLTRSHFAEPTLIKRGEHINIQSGKTGLIISAPGIAITDGVKGQQIPVKNASSQRVIHATVVAAGQVIVKF